MSVLGTLYRGETGYDFVGRRRTFFVISGVLIAISIISLATRKLDGSVDFTGGTIVEAPNEAGVTIGEVRSALSAIGEGGARVQLVGDNDDLILVQTRALSVQHQDELVSAVAAIAGASVDDTNVDAVGPTFGAEITRRAVEALVIFLGVVALFITWRFEWKMAMAAMAALFHDLLITAGFYSVVGFEVTPSTVIAVLTILGYSLYDTVVVFDKIIENARELANKQTYGEIANLSMNQVLMRSINTSLTTLLPIGSLLFVGSYALGADTLREFALALFVGVAAGTYSSIFIATPLLTLWKEREPQWRRMERRAERRVPELLEQAAVASPARQDVAVEPRSPAASGAVPRPPRQRKKRR
ncbi:MAG TPA: protein translocase subunit SecF [Acidimicrobiia bacterium]